MLKLINKKLTSLVIITLLCSSYLQTSYGAAQSEESTDRAILEISKKIALLELEIKLIKIQQQKSEAMSRKILEMVVGQDVNDTIIPSSYPDKEKSNFFVPAGW